MGKGLPRSLARARGTQGVVKEVIRLEDLAVGVDGLTGVGFGGSQIPFAFPEGFVVLLAAKAVVNLTATTGNITATFDGDVAVGTTVAGDGTLTGADVDILPSTALGAATASVSPTVTPVNVTAAEIDNSANDVALYFNVLIDDAAIDADTQNVNVNGLVYLVYTVLGDD